jgi:hypothetical protein
MCSNGVFSGVNAGSLVASLGAATLDQSGGTPGVTAVVSGRQAVVVLIAYAVAFDALASLLKEDAVMAMPPEAQWFRGRSAIVDFFATVPAAGRLEEIRLMPVGSNRQPAVAAYIADPGEGVISSTA